MLEGKTRKARLGKRRGTGTHGHPATPALSESDAEFLGTLQVTKSTPRAWMRVIVLGPGDKYIHCPGPSPPLLGVPQAQQTEQPDGGSVTSAAHSVAPPPSRSSIHGASERCFACRELTLSVRQCIVPLLREVLPAVLDDDEVLEMDGGDGCTTQ